MKRGEIFQDRLNQLQTADAYKGVFFSKQCLAKNILQFTDDEWAEIQSQIKAEKAEGGDEEDDGYDSFGYESEPKPIITPKDDSVDDAELEDEERYEDKE